MACSNLLVLGIALCKIVSVIPVIDDKSITSGADLIKGLGHLSSQDQSDGNSVPGGEVCRYLSFLTSCVDDFPYFTPSALLASR